MPAARRPPGHAERLAGGDPQLLADDVDPGAELGDRVLDLQAGVQLDEVEAPVGAEQELEGAGVAVADRTARALGGRLHLLARLGRQGGRRRLLDQLLVAALDRALALAEREDVAEVVAQHLDLDVARRDERLLDVERGVAERGLRLGRGGGERILELVRSLDEPHPLAAAARARLEQDRVAELVGGRARPVERSSRRRRPARSAPSARRIACFAAILSPIVAITSAGGPTKTRSLSTQASTKAGFSARKP